MTSRQVAITTAQQLVTRCSDAIADFAASPAIGTHFADYRRQAQAFLGLARKRTTGERMISTMRADMRKLSERISWTYERAVGGEIHSPVVAGPVDLQARFGGPAAAADPDILGAHDLHAERAKAGAPQCETEDSRVRVEVPAAAPASLGWAGEVKS